jgi:hypothetical protein
MPLFPALSLCVLPLNISFCRLSLSGGSSECSATITGVKPEDAGKWRCMLADQTDYATVTRTLELGVGQAGVLGWAGSLRQGGRLEVKENEEVRQK